MSKARHCPRHRASVSRQRRGACNLSSIEARHCLPPNVNRRCRESDRRQADQYRHGRSPADSLAPVIDSGFEPNYRAFGLAKKNSCHGGLQKQVDISARYFFRTFSWPASRSRDGLFCLSAPPEKGSWTELLLPGCSCRYWNVLARLKSQISAANPTRSKNS